MADTIVSAALVALAMTIASCSGEDSSGSAASTGAGSSGSGGSTGSGDSTAGSGGSDVPPTKCKLGFLGDPASPVEMKLVALGADEVSTEITDGSLVPMILPPQGGRVIFVGARATNIGACGVELQGTLRDNSSQQIRVDARTTNLKPTGDGWGGPVDADISTFSNIPTCPNQWASTAVHDVSFELSVTLTDRDGRTATKTIQVVPHCAEPEFEAECLCQCQDGYMLGQVCDGSGS